MKAISLWQPWAQAMALGLKRNETRHWPTNYRGDIVICSAKRPLDSVGREICREAEISADLLQFGYALCIVEIYDVDHTQALFHQPGNEPGMLELLLGDYSAGRFAWRTKNLRRLAEPVPITGRQGLFNITGETAERILEQVKN